MFSSPPAVVGLFHVILVTVALLLHFYIEQVALSSVYIVFCCGKD